MSPTYKAAKPSLVLAFDDVERKTREMIEPAQALRKLVPDEERKSLSALYEQEFLQVFSIIFYVS